MTDAFKKRHWHPAKGCSKKDEAQQVSVDVTSIPATEALLEVYCSDNAITALDLSNNRLLGTLNCSSNILTTLDESTYTGMKTLNVRSNPNLKEIWLQTNQTISRLQKIRLRKSSINDP